MPYNYQKTALPDRFHSLITIVKYSVHQIADISQFVPQNPDSLK